MSNQGLWMACHLPSSVDIQINNISVEPYVTHFYVLQAFFTRVRRTNDRVQTKGLATHTVLAADISELVAFLGLQALVLQRFGLVM